MSSAEHASRAYVNEFFTLRFDSTSPSSGKQRSRGRGRGRRERRKRSECHHSKDDLGLFPRHSIGEKSPLLLLPASSVEYAPASHLAAVQRSNKAHAHSVRHILSADVNLSVRQSLLLLFGRLLTPLSSFHSTHGGGRGLSFGSGLEIAISEMLFQAGRPRPSKKWESPMRPTFLAAADSTSATDDRKQSEKKERPLARSILLFDPAKVGERIVEKPSFLASLCVLPTLSCLFPEWKWRIVKLLSSFLLLCYMSFYSPMS